MAKSRKVSKLRLVQVSKEYLDGKWRKVGFYESKTGRVTIKVLS